MSVLLRIGVLLALAGIVPHATKPAEDATPFFTDMTLEAGVSFRHEHGGSGKRYMVEIAGGGVLVFDYDADGRSDLYFVNGQPLPGDRGGPARNALYRNLGGGRFEDVTVAAGVEGRGYEMGGVAADFDNDGDADLFVTAFGEDTFYRNNGDGTFTERTKAWGLGENSRWSTSAAAFDADGDGILDLYVANYLDFTLANHRECVSPTKGLPSYCHPAEYEGVEDVFYRGRAAGRFDDETERSGVTSSAGGKGLGVAASDYDDDGDVDIYVANDTTPNFLFRNDGSARFEEAGLDGGVAFNEEGLPEAGMGTDWGDVDRDGQLDLVVTNFDFETNTLYQNVGQGFFFDATTAFGLGDESLTELGFGCELLDLDSDGWLDLIVTNGHILDNIAEIQSNLSFPQPAQFFRNRAGRFYNESDEGGPVLERARVGRGLASLDADGDGDLDIALAVNGGPAELLRNDATVGGSVVLLLVGRASNRDGIGGRVFGSLGGRPWVEEVRAGVSYLSQSELALRIGLGELASADGFSLRWPSGQTTKLPSLSDRHLYVVKEGVGIVSESRIR